MMYMSKIGRRLMMNDLMNTADGEMSNERS